MSLTTIDSLVSQAEIFPWSDNFATGIAEIDVQHRKLVDLLNQLAINMAYRSDALTLQAVFDELADYAVHHFQTEEAIWEKHLAGDAMVLAHAHAHQNFVAEVLKVRAQAVALNTDETVEEIISFLTHWLAFHILEDDTQMARVVSGLQRGLGLTQAKAEALQQMKGAAHVLIDAVLQMYDSMSARTMALLREIRQRRIAEDKLRLSCNIIESSLEAIFITDPQGFITDANPAFCQDVKLPLAQLLGQTIRSVKPFLFAQDKNHDIWAMATEQGHWAGEVAVRRPSGELEPIWLTLSTVKDEQRQTTHFVGMLSSMSQLLQRHKTLELAANHDSLTGLPNRRLLNDRLKQAVGRSKREVSLLALCFMDLDNFKPINDTLGHDAGDEVLRVVAQRLTAALRGADTVARIGGDEFVLLMGDLAHADEAAALLARLLHDVRQPIVLQGKSMRVGCSIGYTLHPGDDGSPEELIKHADLALYQAKALGKGRVQLFEVGPPEGLQHGGSAAAQT